MKIFLDRAAQRSWNEMIPKWDKTESDTPISEAFADFKFAQKLDSGDYSLYFYRVDNILIVLEESYKYDSSGYINMVYICTYFSPDLLDESKNKALDSWARRYNLSGFTKPWADGHYSLSLHPQYGINALLAAISALQNFAPEKGTTQYWDARLIKHVDYEID